jgi:DNA-directed RNA polymerase subunit F
MCLMPQYQIHMKPLVRRLVKALHNQINLIELCNSLMIRDIQNLNSDLENKNEVIENWIISIVDLTHYFIIYFIIRINPSDKHDLRFILSKINVFYFLNHR